MNAKQFEKFLDAEEYQVFLFVCPATVPFMFARHPWLVVNRKGVISRWEIFWQPQKWDMRWGHLHKDFHSPVQGIAMFFFTEKYLWSNGAMIGMVEGPEHSLAQNMAELIERSSEVYPYNNTYALTGPNSNTYVQWVLDHFPESGLHLPWNSFGKKYAEHES